MVNSDCELKVCDFGLSRAVFEDCKDIYKPMTNYMITRWYRAPEIIMEQGNYGKAVDVWSVGNIIRLYLRGNILRRKIIQRKE